MLLALLACVWMHIDVVIKTHIILYIIRPVGSSVQYLFISKNTVRRAERPYMVAVSTHEERKKFP